MFYHINRSSSWKSEQTTWTPSLTGALTVKCNSKCGDEVVDWHISAHSHQTSYQQTDLGGPWEIMKCGTFWERSQRGRHELKHPASLDFHAETDNRICLNANSTENTISAREKRPIRAPIHQTGRLYEQIGVRVGASEKGCRISASSSPLSLLEFSISLTNLNLQGVLIFVFPLMSRKVPPPEFLFI